jgi:hypothetical protein
MMCGTVIDYSPKQVIILSGEKVLKIPVDRETFEALRIGDIADVEGWKITVIGR